ncbi:MAG: hypothetical protein IKF22_12425 [Lachnospiraceae bacterium]|jgi:uncharacterized protein YukE|nr:hypothetical protein [Lachnospiraceae bacterium]
MPGVGSGITILVDTEELKVVSESVQQSVGEMQVAYESLGRAVTVMGDYWIGEASEKERQAFFSQKDSIEGIIRRLSEYPVDLMKMAGIYVEHERSNAEIPSGLSGDVLL